MVNKNIQNRAYIYTGDKSGQVTVAISQKFLDTVLFYIRCVLYSLRREGCAGWVWRRAMEGTSWTCVLGIPTSHQICAALLRVARRHFLQQKGKIMHSNIIVIMHHLNFLLSSVKLLGMLAQFTKFAQALARNLCI